MSAAVQIGDEDPITLAEACEWYFRDRITPATLRAERDRGRLATMKIGRTEFTTRAAIQEMQRLCQEQSAVPAFGSARAGGTRTEQPIKQRGSSSTAESITPQDALRAKLSGQTPSSRSTSRKSTSRGAPSAH